jgi:hypothetical protein
MVAPNVGVVSIRAGVVAAPVAFAVVIVASLPQSMLLQCLLFLLLSSTSMITSDASMGTQEEVLMCVLRMLQLP